MNDPAWQQHEPDEDPISAEENDEEEEIYRLKLNAEPLPERTHRPGGTPGTGERAMTDLHGVTIANQSHDRCEGCLEVPASVTIGFRHTAIRLCWTCAMGIRNVIERERLQKHEHLDEMENIEAEYGL